MDKRLVNALKQRFEFDSWRGANTLRRNLFIWHFALASYQLPGWKLVSAKRVELPGVPPQLQSLWQRAGSGGNTILRLDVFDCASREAAHEWLLELLGNAQSPLLDRANHLRIGDVAFNGGSNPWLAYARANLVILLRNAGPAAVEVIEPAKTLDEELASESPAERIVETGEPAPTPLGIRRFEVAAKRVRSGKITPLDVEIDEPPDSPTWYKIFSDGEVLVDQGKLAYKAGTAKNQSITLVAVASNRPATSRILRLNVTT